MTLATSFHSVSSHAKGHEMPGVFALHLNSSSLEHVDSADTKSGLVCLSLFFFLPLSGQDLLILGGRWMSAEFSSCHSLIKMNLEENSSQQPPGMCGGGWISGLFFYKVLAGFWFGNPKFKWKICDWDKIHLRSKLTWFCFRKPQTILVCSSQKWGRKPHKLLSDPSSKFFWCPR